MYIMLPQTIHRSDFIFWCKHHWPVSQGVANCYMCYAVQALSCLHFEPHSWMLMLISLFHHIIICLNPVFLIYFRILFPLIPYTSQATTVLPARVLEAAGCHSPQSASAGLSWRCNDGEGARHRHIRGQHCIPQIPRSSWSLLVFGAETWLVIVAFILPVLIGPTDQLPPEPRLVPTMSLSLLHILVFSNCFGFVTL